MAVTVRRVERATHVTKTVDRLMVCLSSDPRLSRLLLRKASRIAGRLNSDWSCVDVGVTLAPFAAERGVSGGDETGRRCGPTGRVWRKHWYCSAPYRRMSVLMPTRHVVEQGVDVRLPVQRTVRT